MIIKNNFDDKKDLPDDDYQKIGKGSYNIEKRIEQEKKVNPFYEIENNRDRENDDDDKHDDWEFFK